jgi:hypothetical protein
MKLKWLPMLWFCYGASIGVLLGANLGRGFSEAASIVILALGILFLVFLWRPIESQRTGLPVKLADYGMTKPTAARVASVADEGELELQLFFVKR